MNTNFHWDNIAEDYNKWVMGESDLFGQLISKKRQDTFVTILNNPLNKTILDLGCGEGIIGRLFSNKNNVFGIDYSEKLIKIAQSKDSTIKYEVSDIQLKLPYLDNQFDFVVSNMVLMDIEKIESLIVEVNRKLKVGGKFIFSIKHPCFDKNWLNQDNTNFKYLDTFEVEKKITPNFNNFCQGFHRPIEYYINTLLINNFKITIFNEVKINHIKPSNKNYDLIANDLFIGCLKND
jgi:ubiquinone/menaquinone biosynthesis C-methylase UbiE